ncbi:MAG: hypothetical protein ACR2FQ_11965 [Pseudonocardiaceae bacterium]
MSTVRRLPARRDLFVDQRGADRGLRVTSHPDEGVVVISLWHDNRCTATFRLPVAEAVRMIAVLAAGLGDQLPEHQPRPARAADGGTGGKPGAGLRRLR